MIKQRVGDLLQIRVGRKHFYVVVLTDIVSFGGNIVFAFHNDGKKRKPERFLPDDPGFNVCTDLLLPKREDRVERIADISDLTGYWRTKLVKSTPTFQTGMKAALWFINPMNRLGGAGTRVEAAKMTQQQKEAMDGGCQSFDLVAEMILRRYTPDQNEHL